jgi:energy-coupling factor transport system ATP-binding protein
MAILFQDPDSQLITGDIESEIAFPIENLGWDRGRIDRRVRELIARFQLTHLIGRSLERFSGGEKSWVSLAASLASSPKYLFLDEPGVFLDAGARARLRAGVQALVDDGMGVLWITQFEEEWKSAQRHLVFEGGEISMGEPDRLSTSRPAAVVNPPTTAPLARPEVGARIAPAPPPGPIVLTAEGIEFQHGEAEPGPSDDHPVAGRFELGPISLTVAAGERVFLRGESGSGKTTLLLLLAGVPEPRCGRITYEPTPERRPRASEFAVLLQSPEDQLVSPTVEEDILLGLRLQGLATDDARLKTRESLRAMGLDPQETASLSPGSLSHGQRRRVAWCGIWALEAGVWLLDEPTAGLDGAAVEVLREATADFLRDGGAIVLVTQDPRLQSWDGRNIFLENGRETSTRDPAADLSKGPEIANFP